MTATVDLERQVKRPAIALLVVFGVSIVVLFVSFLFNIFLLTSRVTERLPEPSMMTKETQVVVRMVAGLVAMALHALTIAGALHMRQFRSLGLARAGAIVACIPCVSACVVLGIPFGAWALIVLGRPEVRAAFRD